MLETTAAEVYGFDLDALRVIGDEVGPTVAEVRVPLDPADYPDRLDVQRVRRGAGRQVLVTGRSVQPPHLTWYSSFHHSARRISSARRDEARVLAEIGGRRPDAFARSGAARRGRSRSTAPRSRRAAGACRRPGRRRSPCADARSCAATCLRGAGSRCPTSRRRNRWCGGGGSPPSTSSTRRRRCSCRSTPTAASRGCPSSARPSSSSCGRRRSTDPTSTSCRRPSSTRLRSRRTSGRGSVRTRR